MSTVVDLYTIQIIRDGTRIYNFDVIPMDSEMAETEENLTDLLPPGYRARFRKSGTNQKGTTMSDEAVKVQYEGVCEEISEKNGGVQFSINVGSKYPVRLSTKLPCAIEQARAAGQQHAVWSAKESQGGENPNKPGTFYTNRYLDGVEVGGVVSQPAASASGSAPSGAKTQTVDGTRSSIERQVIVKEMVKYYPALDALTVDGWWGLMGELEEFLANGVPKAAPVPEVAADDGIPFE